MKRFLFLGGLMGALGVAAGAFGAHVLKSRLEPALLAAFHTAARYHLVHALALLLVALLIERSPRRSLSFAGWSFFAGIVLFSGSLYLMAVTSVRALGAITPLGGLAFIAGWIAVAMSARSSNKIASR